jgi:hypothetical protein
MPEPLALIRVLSVETIYGSIIFLSLPIVVSCFFISLDIVVAMHLSNALLLGIILDCLDVFITFMLYGKSIARYSCNALLKSKPYTTIKYLRISKQTKQKILNKLIYIFNNKIIKTAINKREYNRNKGLFFVYTFNYLIIEIYFVDI